MAFVGSEESGIQLKPVTVSWPNVDGSLRRKGTGRGQPVYSLVWNSADGEEKISTGAYVEQGDCLAVLSLDVRVSSKGGGVSNETVRIEIEAPCSGSVLLLEQAEEHLINSISQVYLRYIRTDQPIAYIVSGGTLSRGKGRLLRVQDERPYNDMSSDVYALETEVVFYRQVDQLHTVGVDDCKKVPKEWKGYDYFFYAGYLEEESSGDHLGDVCKQMREGENGDQDAPLQRERIYYLVDDGEQVEYNQTVGLLCPPPALSHGSDSIDGASQTAEKTSGETEASPSKSTTERETANLDRISSSASAFGTQLLNVLSEDWPLSTSEIIKELTDTAMAREEVVEAYLRHGINNHVEEVRDNHWVLSRSPDAHSSSPDQSDEEYSDSGQEGDAEPVESVSYPEPSDTDSSDEAGSRKVEPSYEEQDEHSDGTSSPSEAVESAPMPDNGQQPYSTARQAFLQLLAEDEEPIGVSDLTTRLQTKGYDVSSSEIATTIETLREIVAQPQVAGWNDEQQSSDEECLFHVPTETRDLMEGLRTASKLVALLECSTQPIHVVELHHILVRLGHDTSEDDVKHVLEHILSGAVQQTEDGKWTLPDDEEVGLSELGPRNRNSAQRPTPDEFIGQVANWLDGSRQAVIPSSWITERWASEEDGHLSREEARALSGFLSGYGFGIEPDIRFGGNPSDCQHVVVFRDENDDEEERTRFDAARLLLELGAAVASADDDISREEERRIEQHLEEALYLNHSERARLRAHLERRMSHPPRITDIRRRARALPEDDRHRLATFLLTVAGADGLVQQEEIALLKKIYAVLQLDVEDLKQDLRSMAAPIEDASEDSIAAIEQVGAPMSKDGSEAAPASREDGQITDETSSTRSHTEGVGRSTQSETERGPSGIELDVEKVGRIQAETRDVAQVLQKVFEDPEDEVEASSIRGVGLDEEHVALLSTLEQRSQWPRDQFDALAEQHDLMPGFAIEQINAVAFEKVDEPLLEGEDHIELNAYALDALKT